MALFHRFAVMYGPRGGIPSHAGALHPGGDRGQNTGTGRCGLVTCDAYVDSVTSCLGRKLVERNVRKLDEKLRKRMLHVNLHETTTEGDMK